MLVARQDVVDVLLRARLPELAEEAHRELPDPVEYTQAENFLARFGITKDELINRAGGSP